MQPLIKLVLSLVLLAPTFAYAKTLDMFSFEHGGTGASYEADFDNDGVEFVLGGTWGGSAPPTTAAGKAAIVNYIHTNVFTGVCSAATSSVRTKCTSDANCGTGGECMKVSANNSVYLTTKSNVTSWFSKETAIANSDSMSFGTWVHLEQSGSLDGAYTKLFEAAFGGTGLLSPILRVDLIADGTGTSLFRIAFPQSADTPFAGVCQGSIEENQGALCVPCEDDGDCTGGATCANPETGVGACTNTCPSNAINEQTCGADPIFAQNITETAPASAKWAYLGLIYEKDPDSPKKEIRLRAFLDGVPVFTKTTPRGACDSTCDNSGAGCSTADVCGTCTAGGGCSVNDTPLWKSEITNTQWGNFDTTGAGTLRIINFDDVRVKDSVDLSVQYGYLETRLMTGSTPTVETHNQSGCTEPNSHECVDSIDDVLTYYRIQSNHSDDLHKGVMTASGTSGDGTLNENGGIKMYVQLSERNNKSCPGGVPSQIKAFEFCLGPTGTPFQQCAPEIDFTCVADGDPHWLYSYLWPGAGAGGVGPWNVLNVAFNGNPTVRSGSTQTCGTSCQIEIASYYQEYEMTLPAPTLTFDAKDVNGNGTIDLEVNGDSTLNTGIDDQLILKMPGLQTVYACTRGASLFGQYMDQLDDLLSGDVNATTGLDCAIEAGSNGVPPDFVLFGMGINDLQNTPTNRYNKYCFGSSVTSENGRCCHADCEYQVTEATCTGNGGVCRPVVGLCMGGDNHGEECFGAAPLNYQPGHDSAATRICMQRGTEFGNTFTSACGECTVDADCETSVPCTVDADCKDHKGSTAVLYGTCGANDYCIGECSSGTCIDPLGFIYTGETQESRWHQLDHPTRMFARGVFGVECSGSVGAEGICMVPSNGAIVKQYWHTLTDIKKNRDLLHVDCANTPANCTGCAAAGTCPFEIIYYSQPRSQAVFGAGQGLKATNTLSSAEERSDHVAASVISLAKTDYDFCFLDVNAVFHTDDGLYGDSVHPEPGLGTEMILDMLTSCLSFGTIDGECGVGNTCTTGGINGAKDGWSCAHNADCSTIYCPCVLQ